MGGLELWRPNLCLNCASSSWPWELLCWTECYLFGHLIHTHKWPLGAVFDKQTDWIACVNVCGFSPMLSSRPRRTGPIWLKDMENSTSILTLHTHALMCAYKVYTLPYTHKHTHMHTNLAAALADPASVSFNSVFTHSWELPGLLKVSECAVSQQQPQWRESNIVVCILHQQSPQRSIQKRRARQYKKKKLLCNSYETFNFLCVCLYFIYM